MISTLTVQKKTKFTLTVHPTISLKSKQSFIAIVKLQKTFEKQLFILAYNGMLYKIRRKQYKSFARHEKLLHIYLGIIVLAINGNRCVTMCIIWLRGCGKHHNLFPINKKEKEKKELAACIQRYELYIHNSYIRITRIFITSLSGYIVASQEVSIRMNRVHPRSVYFRGHVCLPRFEASV